MSVTTFEIEKPVEEHLDNVISRFNRVLTACYKCADKNKAKKEKVNANRQ